MADELLLEVVLEIALLVLIIAAFGFAVKNNTDPDRFFMRYQAKDAGLLAEGAHAANGDVTVDYTPHPERRYVYSFLTHGLVVSQQPRGAKGFGGTAFRQPYGYASTPTLAVTTLEQPFVITMLLDDKAIRFNATQQGCAQKLLPARTTKLVLNAPDTLERALRQAPLIQELEAHHPEATSPPGTTIGLTVSEAPAGAPVTITTGSGPELIAAQQLACLLSERLRKDAPTLSIEPDASVTPFVSLLLRLPAGGPVTEAKTATAIIGALDAYVEAAP